jgi:hypothetical protein
VVRDGGAAIPVIQRTLETVGLAGKHQELTKVPAEAMVGAEGGGAVLATCERPVQRRSEHGTAAPAHRQRGS